MQLVYNLGMKCSECKKEMKLVGKDFSYNFKTKPKVKYLRTVYHCATNDIWINVEVPVKK